MTIVEVDFDRGFFKSVTERINDFYKDYFKYELLSKANNYTDSQTFILPYKKSPSYKFLLLFVFTSLKII